MNRIIFCSAALIMGLCCAKSQFLNAAPAIPQPAPTVAFISYNAKGSSINLLRKGKTKTIYSHRDTLLAPTFRPNHNQILFVRYDHTSQPDVRKRKSHMFLIDENGKNLQVLKLPSQFKNVLPFGPSFSSDRKKIVFSGVTGTKLDKNLSNNLYVFDLQQPKKSLRLTNDGGSGGGHFSPDGQKVVFASYRNGNEDIYLIDLKTRHERRLTTHHSGDQSPSWSPDGKHIAWVSYRDYNYEIYVMPISGTGVRRLTRNMGGDFSPTWTSDGRIVFSSKQGKFQSLYIMNADGSNQRRLTSGTADEIYPDCK